MKKRGAGARIVLVGLAVLVTLGMLSTTAFASGTKPIEGFSGSRTLEDTYVLGQSGDPMNIEVRQGEEIRIPLTADMFRWSNGRTTLPLEATYLAEMRKQVAVKTQVRAGSQVLDYVQLDIDTFRGSPFYASGTALYKTGRTAYVSVMFTEEFVSVDDVEFDFTVYLTVNGGRERLSIDLVGEMQVDTIEVYADTDYVNLSEGSVAEAKEWSRDVKAYVGNGVHVTRHMYNEQKYYGISNVKDHLGLEKEEYPEIYPVVAGVVKLEAVNLRSANATVTIDTVQANITETATQLLYVYSDDLNYLGMSNEKLPYSDVYVLTNEPIEAYDTEVYEGNLINPPTNERRS